MTYRKAFFIYLATFFLQPFLQNLIPDFGGHVNLLLCLTVMFSFAYDDVLAGISWGFVFGFLYDMLYGMYAGPGVLSLMVVGIAVLFLREFINIENFFNVIGTMFVSTWLYATVYWGIYAVLGSPYTYLYAMKSLPLPLLFNCLVCAALYFLLIKRDMKYRRDRYFK